MDRCVACKYGSELDELVPFGPYYSNLVAHPICLQLRKSLEDWQYEQKDAI